MKHIWKLAMMAMVALGGVACEGNVDNGDDNVDGPAGDKVYTLQTDKTVIEANGKDAATFTIVDQNGKDVTSQVLRNTSFTNETTNKRLDYGTNTFASIIDGEYTFSATIATSDGVFESQNKVTIKVQNRSKYEKYKQKVAIYKCTGSQCPNCPSMTRALYAVREDLQSNMVIMGLHWKSFEPNGDFICFINNRDLVDNLVNEANLTGFMGIPNNYYKARDLNGSRVTGQIEGILEDYMLDYPTSCGIKISSAVRDGESVTIDCALTTTKSGKYDLGCAVLLDNQVVAGAYEDVYNNVTIAITPNYTGKLSSDYLMMQANTEQSKTMTLTGIKSKFDAKDLRVVVFALTELEDGTTIMDNCQVCPVGGSADYELN